MKGKNIHSALRTAEEIKQFVLKMQAIKPPECEMWLAFGRLAWQEIAKDKSFSQSVQEISTRLFLYLGFHAVIEETFYDPWLVDVIISMPKKGN